MWDKCWGKLNVIFLHKQSSFGSKEECQVSWTPLKTILFMCKIFNNLSIKAMSLNNIINLPFLKPMKGEGIFKASATLLSSRHFIHISSFDRVMWVSDESSQLQLLLATLLSYILACNPVKKMALNENENCNLLCRNGENVNWRRFLGLEIYSPQKFLCC